MADSAPSIPSDEPASGWLPDFRYEYPAGLPRSAQEELEKARLRADHVIGEKPLRECRFAEYRKACEEWFWGILKPASATIRRVGALSSGEAWNPNARRKELWRIAFAAADAARLPTPARERLFDSNQWQRLLSSAGAPPTTIPGRKPGIPVNGEALKGYRKSIEGLSQEKLAEECGLSVDTIQRGEKGGRWPESTFRAVAKTLRRLTTHPVTPEDLMAG